MVTDQRSPCKTDRADQTVSHRDLKLGGMVVLTPPTMWLRLAPIGLTGALQRSKVRNHSCLRFDREAKFSGIPHFLKNLLLRSSPRFFARSELNQCRKILWRMNINNYQKKKKSWTFDSPSQRDAKTFERGRATFSKMPITPERNEIFSPNSPSYHMAYHTTFVLYDRPPHFEQLCL